MKPIKKNRKATKGLNVEKTCSCGVTYTRLGAGEYEVNEMGNWFTCFFCKSTMLILHKED